MYSTIMPTSEFREDDRSIVWEHAIIRNPEVPVERLSFFDNVELLENQIKLSATFFNAYFVNKKILNYKSARAFALAHQSETKIFSKVWYITVRFNNKDPQKGIVFIRKS